MLEAATPPAPVPVGAAAGTEEVELVVLECVELVDTAALLTGGEFGTVKAGAPAVSVPLEPAVPHAARPRAATAAAASTAGLGVLKGKLIPGTSSRR